MKVPNKPEILSIAPRNVYGIRVEVKGNIHFTSKQEVIYPVAGVLAIHDYKTNNQTFLRFPEHHVPEIISISPNRKMLAISEHGEHKYILNVYDLGIMKKRKTLIFPSDVPVPEAEAMVFTPDSKGLAVLSKEPNAFLTIFYFDKTETIVISRVSNSNLRSLNAKYIACNPNDTGLIAIGGDFTFKLLNRQEKGFSMIGTLNGNNKIITSLAWVTADILVAGTADTQLLFVEGGEPRANFPAETAILIDIEKIKEKELNEGTTGVQETTTEFDASNPRKDVNCMTSYTKGFAYALHNVLHVFEKDTNMRYLKKTIITIPMDLYPVQLYEIQNVAVNSTMDTVLVTTKHSQIFIGMLYVPETLNIKMLTFKTLGEPLHIDGITSVETCYWKPIIMTASKDQTIRIWNYETNHVELVKKYEVDVTVIGLHPCGIFVAVGFSDQLRLMEILLDDLKVFKTFNFPNCIQAVFSHQGHMLACSYGAVITVVSFFSFETIRDLKGHNGLILNLVWSSDDRRLLSSGEDGAVYEWDMLTGARIQEYVQKGNEFRCMAYTTEMVSKYVISHKGNMREIIDSDVVRTITPNNVPLTSIALARSDLVMFLSTEEGHLYSVQLPFLDTGGGKCTNYRFFIRAITCMLITYDDTMLVTCSDDGTLIMWVITNNDGKIAKIDKDLGKCADIVVPRRELIDKIETIASLELRLVQQQAEFQYQMSQGDAFHSEQMRDIHSNYCDAIADLKTQNEQLEMQHIEEFNVITANIAKINDDHARTLLDLEADFHQKIIMEYEKSSKTKVAMDEMRENYEEKLRKSAGCLQDTIEALESDFRKQLQERQDLIRQLMEETDRKKTEFNEYCKQIEIDNDRKTIELKVRYEKELKEERDAMLKWRTEAGVLNKKLITMSQLCEEKEAEKQVLRTEHYKTKNTIQNLRKDIEELRHEIEDRDHTIRNKEKRVNDLQRKNQELEKYKQVLSHKINELKAQIEPREREIKEKKDQILEMEHELEGLQKSNSKSELELSELTDKCQGAEIALKVERDRCRAARNQITKISTDIYKVSGIMQQGDKFKQAFMELFHKYSNEAELKRMYELDTQVETEWMRQRKQLEMLRIRENKSVTAKKSKKGSSDKERLLRENVFLLAELNKIRVELADTQQRSQEMENFLALSSKYMPAKVAREKLNKACAKYDEIEKRYKDKYVKFEEIIKVLNEENHNLHAKIRKLEETEE